VNRNVEIKARLSEPARQREIAAGLADGPLETIEQKDTFFRVPEGRLKLRDLGGGRGELIAYDRSDSAGPAESRYAVVPTADPAALRDLLASVLPVRGVVRKRRDLYRIGRTRVHLDRVEGLGDYLELEVVLEPGEPRERGEAIALDLVRKLEIDDADRVDVAYIDLLEEREDRA
jgi:adenylate cyclase class IV